MNNVTTILKDQGDSHRDTLSVEIEWGGGGAIFIKPKGYGVKTAQDDDGDPILIELYEGKLRVIVWSDINEEDPTHIIELEGAKETNRKEEYND